MQKHTKREVGMTNTIKNIDCLKGLIELPDRYINCCVTSPPYYGLRDYGIDGQLGLEATPEEYVNKLVQIFSEVKRVLKDDGTLWLNLGDSYAGSGSGGGTKSLLRNIPEVCFNNRPVSNAKAIGLKSKDLIGIPWMVAFALRADGWYLRQDIIWHKPNPMPESVTDRCTKSHEYIFLMAKSRKYYYDNEAIWEIATGYDGRKDLIMKGSTKYQNGYTPTNVKTQTIALTGHARWKEKRDGMFVRNKRSVWTVNTQPYSGAHFATFPQELIVDMIKAGCPEGGIVLDPFMGAGTTAVVSRKLNRNYIGFEINPDYIKIAEKRLYDELGMYL